jgi:hypothetical protein
MFARAFAFVRTVCGMLLIISFAGAAYGQALTPAHEQEFIDAKAALEAAQVANAVKYEPDKLKEAEAFLKGAEHARFAKDEVQFSRSSHLARILSESARNWTELKISQEKLLATQDELARIKEEIRSLNKAQ